MTLDQLRIFVAVAEREHMTRAADALGLTQSAVSSAIAALEAKSGLALFNRVGRHIELSAEGRVFLDEARAVLARAEAAERALVDLSGFRRGSLNIQASQTVASYWLPGRLAAFHKTYPSIEVKLSIGNTAQVARGLNEGIAELGFVEGQVQDPLLTPRVVGRDRLIVVVRPDHAWARLPRLAIQQLAQEAWVLREAGSGTRSEFEASLASHGLSIGQLKIALELPSNEAVRAAVEAGAGVTAISELAAQHGIRAGLLTRVEFHLPDRPFHLLYHRERRLSRAASAFLALLHIAPDGI